MRHIIFSSILVITLILAVSSCQDFLEEVNPNELSTDNYWKTLDDCNAGLTAVYGAFKDNDLLAVVAETQRSDLSPPAIEDAQNPYYNQTFTNASDAPNGKWEALYTGIFRANQVIKAISDIEPTLTTEEEKETSAVIVAQARFFRGLFYFYLHNSFNNGSVIIYDFVPENEADFYEELSQPGEVKEFYLEDLDFAYMNLPAKWTATNDLGRVTSGAAAAVMGKSYLYEKDYEEAKKYFKDVIENSDYGYQLAEHVGDNFTTRNELNSESILEIVYSLNFKQEIDVWSDLQTSTTLNYYFSRVGGWSLVYPTAWLVMKYKEDPLDDADPRNYVTDEDGTTRLRKYSLRTSYSIALVDDPDLDYYMTTPAQAAIFNEYKTAYYRKYTNWDIVENENDIVPKLRSGINIRVIRLADVYLMYAECLIEGGTNDAGVEEAMLYINKVRRRSALQLIGPNASGEFPLNSHDNRNYDAASLMDHLIYHERPLELSAEGHAIRTLDLRRWGITKQRFEELSTRVYHGEDYSFTTEEGETDARWQSVLHYGPAENPTDNIQQYVQSAANYNENIHGYWPIPITEINANPSIE